ncbi:hypothetical protein FOL46_009626 [Perkinsus olseni]|uniref:NADP-dependent oxidoreductase domain-containing protein n=1 Tax=Perkinsus olseni TaxID=32597 RepID=A0A7J6MW28_PEROL|nr:hypothetical protein FOL46_009626 [Perkinsus olseni]
MPVVGLGTFMSKGDEVEKAVYSALQLGYRHIDTADLYMNHERVGKALKRAIDDGIVKRSEVFLVSKLWPTDYRADVMRPRVEKMLSDLQVGYLDQLLLHMPEAWDYPGESDDYSRFFPTTTEGLPAVNASHDLVDTWRVLEGLCEERKVRSIGVSNFDIVRMRHLLRAARIKPAVNQVEVHPFLPQKELLEFCRDEGVAIVAYAPLGAPAYP